MRVELIDSKICSKNKSSVFSFEGTNFNGLVAQLVRAPPCHGGGRGFEPHPGRLAFMFCLRVKSIDANIYKHVGS